MDLERSGRRTAGIVLVAILLGLIGLGGRLYYLQVAGHDRYSDIKADQSRSVLNVSEPRRSIFDAAGRIFADSKPV